MVLDGFGWFWVVPCFSNYESVKWFSFFLKNKFQGKHKTNMNGDDSIAKHLLKP